MKKLLFLLPLFALLSFAMIDFAEPEAADAPTIQWMTWEEMVVAQQTDSRKVMVDVYTDWCGWCKRMDKTTFVDPKVTALVNEKFYAVKLDAEQREDIQYNEHTFKWVAGGRNGVHQLAYSLLDGRLSYPSIVYLNENMERITIAPGFKDQQGLLKDLNFVVNEEYK